MNITDLSSYFCDITGYVLAKRLLVASGLFLSSFYGLTPAICGYFGFSYAWTFYVTYSVSCWNFFFIPIHSLGLIKYMAGHEDFRQHYLYTVNGTIQKVTPIEFHKLKSAVSHSNIEAITKIHDNFSYHAVDPSLVSNWVSMVNL
jgi:hypothetical protein